MIGTSVIAEVRTGVSPRGDTLSPIDPPDSIAPMVKGRLAPVLTARGRPRGIIKAHVAQDEPIKYDVKPAIKNMAAGIRTFGIKAATVFETKLTKPKSWITLDNDQLKINITMGGEVLSHRSKNGFPFQT